MLILGNIYLDFGIFCLILFYLFSESVMKKGFVPSSEKKGIKSFEIAKATLQLIIAVSVVILSAYLVTHCAIELAKIVGIAESLLGASIIAIGTTMPELSINLSAIRKRNISLAIGDIIGSIITNMTLILGIVAMINPVTLGPNILFLLLTLIIINMIFILMANRMKFGIKEGIFLLSVYSIYILTLILLGVEL